MPTFRARRLGVGVAVGHERFMFSRSRLDGLFVHRYSHVRLTMQRVGIDIGGTFTDFVLHDERAGTVTSWKRLSTPAEPEIALLQGLDTVDAAQDRVIVHGSTVATNALLERKGAPTALVTTAGFRDILHIGRQTRPDLYDLFPRLTPPLIPRHLCFEVRERIDERGDVVVPLNMSDMETILERLREAKVTSVAISLLFAFVYPDHERRVAERCRAAGLFVTASHELVPEFREYERTSTVAVNAYVSPVLDRYLARVQQKTEPAAFHILQSNGGRLSVTQARGQGVRSILSGPAGGVVGARYAAQRAGCSPIVTFDMGGTSTDVSLVTDHLRVTTEARVGGLPIRVPVIDIHTVGSGGGSLASVDIGGSLRVGPQSAGAEPGPACYGRGGMQPTVTDANLCLGRLPHDGFLGGSMPLDVGRAEEAMRSLASALSLADLPACEAARVVALGIVRVVNAHMERAIRVISVERGHDPRECTLVSFGGAGGLHAVDLARQLGIPTVLIPPQASTLSAFGMLAAPVQMDYVQTVMLADDAPYADLVQRAQPLVERGARDVEQQGVAPEQIAVTVELDVRYHGQSFELAVPLTPQFREVFDTRHTQRYGFHHAEARVDIVNIRVRAVGVVEPVPLPEAREGPSDPTGALWCRRPVFVDDGMQDVAHYAGARLSPGHVIEGPAIIVQEDTTICIGAKDRGKVDRFGNVVLHVGT